MFGMINVMCQLNDPRMPRECKLLICAIGIVLFGSLIVVAVWG